MSLDSYHRKNLEQRAKENGRAIDTQWIRENETRESYYTGSNKKTSQESREDLISTLNEIKALIADMEIEANINDKRR